MSKVDVWSDGLFQEGGHVEWEGWMHTCPVKGRWVWWPWMTSCMFCRAYMVEVPDEPECPCDEEVSDEPDRPASQA